MKSTVTWAQNQTSEIQDAVEEPKITRIYKGQSAPFDGALMPFNTLKQFEEFRINYEFLKKDYVEHGISGKSSSMDSRNNLAYFSVVLLSGALVGMGFSSSSSETVRVIGISAAALGIVGGLVILSW